VYLDLKRDSTRRQSSLHRGVKFLAFTATVYNSGFTSRVPRSLFGYRLFISCVLGCLESISCVTWSVFRSNNCVPPVSHAAGSLRPVKDDKVIRGEKGKDLLVIKGFKFRFQKFLLKIWNDDDVLIKSVNAT